jgi:class 3 adenylate cyclase/tetratricopeptide (TPR) repeat protein
VTSHELLDQASLYIPEEWRHALSRGEILPEHASGDALFADISGFTATAEVLARVYGLRQGAEELILTINAIFDVLICEVNRFSGSVISFSGDAITCWFDDHAAIEPGAANGSQRAAQCALAMQSAMRAVRKVAIPGEDSISLAVKISIAAGPIRRFLAGDPAIQRIPILAGDTLQRMAAGAHLAGRGEVLVDDVTASTLGQRAMWGEPRLAGDSDRFTVLVGLDQQFGPAPWPELLPHAIPADRLRLWLLPQVYARLEQNLGEFLTELRPGCALFIGFSGIDYDHDPLAGEKLNDLACRAQNELARSEGTLLQIIIDDKGSYLYAVFGAPTAHEDDAQRAVKAALNLRELILSLDWQKSVQIGVSMGALRTGAYGGRMRRTYSALGDDVNLAARLMSRAGSGEVLITNRVYKAIAGDARLRSSGFSFEPKPPIRFKGKSEPLPVFAIVGIHKERPIRLQEPGITLPMVGREKELQTLENKLDLVLARQGQVVGITSEAGLGKSRLVAEAIRHARSKGLVGYGGACQSDGIHTSYLVWGPVWRAIFEINPDAPLHRQIRNLEGMIEELAPARMDAIPLLGSLLGMTIPENEFTATLEPRSRRSALHALLLDCLQSASQEAAERSTANEGGGLLLVLEDVHWIDQASTVLLEVLARSIASLPVLILLAYRPFEREQDEIRRLETLPYFTGIALSELSAVDAEQAVRAKLAQLYPEWRGAAPKKLIQSVIHQAEGNPFYAEEFLNYLHDRDIDLHDDRAIEALDVPTSLHSLILSRIDQLVSRQQLTLKVASIIGRLFRFDHLYGYYPDLGPSELLHSDLDYLASIDLTPLETPEPEPTYLFRHIITQEVAYKTLPAATRALLHEVYARFLEARAGENLSRYLDLLAYHYGCSENLPKKLEYLRRAADAAAARFSNEDAIRYYQRALTVLDEKSHQENDLALAALLSERLGDILNLLTRHDEARAAYQTALKCLPTSQPIERAHLTCKIANTWRDQHDYEDSLKVYSEALHILGDPAQAGQEATVDRWLCWIQIQLEMLSSYYWLAWVPQSEETCTKIQSVLEQVGTPAQRASFFGALAAHSVRRDRYYLSSEGVTYFKAALEAYQQAAIHENIPSARFQYGWGLLFMGEYDLAEEQLAASLQLSEQRGDLSLQARCLTYLTILYRQKGLVEKVEAYAVRSLACAGAAHMPEYVGAARANLGWAAWRAGNCLAAREHCLAAFSLWEQSPGIRAAATAYYWVAVWPMIALELAEVHPAEAVRYARSLLEPSQARMPDELAALLEQASASWDASHAETASETLSIALALAKKFHYI